MSYEKDVHFCETSGKLHGNDPSRQQAPVEPTWNVSITQARGAALAEYDRDRMARACEALYDAVTRS